MSLAVMAVVTMLSVEVVEIGWGGGLQCGCFGKVSVPRAVTWGILGIGGVGLAMYERAGLRVPWRLGLLPAMVVVSGAWLGIAGGQEKAWQQRVEAVRGAGRCVLVVVSPSCEHCREWLKGLVAKCAEVRAQGRGVEMVMLVPEDEVGKVRRVPRDTVVVGISLMEWAGLVGKAPPAVYEWSGQVAEAPVAVDAEEFAKRVQ